MFDFNVEKTNTSEFDSHDLWDMLVVGGGPAGLNAALYAKRKGLKVGIITDEIGGQLHNTTDVDNYLGFSLVKGPELSQSFLDHVNNLDIPILKGVKVKTITHSDPDFALQLTDGKQVNTKTLIIATGGAPKKLDIPGEKALSNKGVTYCATCDAPFFKDKHVIVAGGGNSAAEGVLDLVSFARKITVVHRSKWRADKVLLDKLNAIDKLTVHLESQLVKVLGDDHVTGVEYLDKKSGEIKQIDAEGLLIEIGNVPKSDFVKDLVKTNEAGEVLVDENNMTSIRGLYAAGDIVAQPHKQIIISVADGAKAALAASQYLNSNYKENK